MSKPSKRIPPKVLNVYANSVFNNAFICQILAKDPQHALKRTVEVTLADLLNDYSNLNYQYTTVKFQIIKVDGLNCYSKFKGHELTRDYVRSLIRVGTSRVDIFYDVFTKENIHVRIQTLAITSKTVSHSIQSKIRKKIISRYDEILTDISFDDLVKIILFGKLASESFEAGKKIYPLKNLEIMKSKVLTPYII